MVLELLRNPPHVSHDHRREDSKWSALLWVLVDSPVGRRALKDVFLRAESRETRHVCSRRRSIALHRVIGRVSTSLIRAADFCGHRVKAGVTGAPELSCRRRPEAIGTQVTGF